MKVISFLSYILTLILLANGKTSIPIETGNPIIEPSFKKWNNEKEVHATTTSTTSPTYIQGITITSSNTNRTILIDDDDLATVLFNMITSNTTLFNDSYLSSLNPTLYPSLISLKEIYETLLFHDIPIESTLAAAYVTLFKEFPYDLQTSLTSEIISLYNYYDGRRLTNSLYLSELGVINFTTAETYDTEVSESTATGQLQAFADLYVMEECVALLMDVETYGYMYNQLLATGTDNVTLQSFKTDYQSWTSAMGNATESLEGCSTIAKYIDFFTWKDRIHAVAKLAFEKKTQTFIKPITVGGKTLTPPETQSGNLTMVTISDSTTTEFVSLDAPFMKTVLLAMITGDQNFFDANYLNELNPTAYSSLSSLKSIYDDYEFRDIPAQSTLAEGYASLFSYIPYDQQLKLVSEITSLYSYYDGRYTTNLYYLAEIGLIGYSTNTISEETQIWETTATGSFGVYSDLYVINECVALQYDMESYGHEYNEFATAATNTNTTGFQSFVSVHNSWKSIAFNQTSSLEGCTTMVQYIDMFPWKGRIRTLAKLAFDKKTATFNSPITVGGMTLSPPGPVNAAVTHIVQVTGTATVSTLYPFEVVFSGRVSDQSTAVTKTQTTTLAVKSLVSDVSSINNVIMPRKTVTSENEVLVTCGVDALIYHYYRSSDDFNNYITKHLNNSDVLSYVNLLSRYSTGNILTNTMQRKDVMCGFYNFIFQLPDDRRNEIIDIMGFCLLQKATDYNIYKVANYNTLDASLFRMLFKFGTGTNFYDIETTSYVSGVQTIIATTTVEAVINVSSSPLLFPTTVNATGANALVNLIPESEIYGYDNNFSLSDLNIFGS